MKIAARQKRGDGARFRECANIGGGDLFEVIATGGAEFDGELSGPGVGKLLGVESRSQSVSFGFGQDLTGLFAGESASIAEDVAEFSQAVADDFGKQLVEKQANVFFGAISD
jgi:hypothetical protein